MDKDTVIRNLCDAFETIKDSWETKKEAIIDCIVETEIYDGDLAMDMWLYILNKEGEHISSYDGVKYFYFGFSNDVEYCIGNVFKAFFHKYEEYELPIYMCKVLFEHIVPHIIKKDRLLEILFEKSHNMSYCTDIMGSGYPYSLEHYKNEFIPALIACIFLIDNPLVSQKIMNNMINNTNYLDWESIESVDYTYFSVGKLIRISKKYIQTVYKCKEDYNWNYKITKRVKDALLSCVDRIEYAKNRAECTIEIISL